MRIGTNDKIVTYDEIFLLYLKKKYENTKTIIRGCAYYYFC